jgi:predicted  nucleic acid-binding Zn-ribbon protein
MSYVTSTAKENVSQYGILSSRREDTMQTQEERLVALEQRVDALQRDSTTNHSDNTRLLTILNKVVATQELNYRELSENQTMLAGIISSQGIDIKEIKKDIGTIKEQLSHLETLLAQILARLPEQPYA